MQCNHWLAIKKDAPNSHDTMCMPYWEFWKLNPCKHCYARVFWVVIWAYIQIEFFGSTQYIDQMPESIGKDQMNIIDKGMWDDLDSDGMDGRNHIQWPTKHVIVLEIRIIFPDGTECCDVAHYVNGGEINNVAKESKTRFKRQTVNQEWNIQ